MTEEEITEKDISWFYYCLDYAANENDDVDDVKRILRNFAKRFPQYTYYNRLFMEKSEWKKSIR